MIAEQEIISKVDNGFGHLILNRPKALNALSFDMILEMREQLENWKNNPLVHSVILSSNNERAFCAGGDVKAVAEDTENLANAFFREEYALNAEIAYFPKPYISFMNGIVMGGGGGISLHGSHRIVTDSTKFAMPETKIGYFPDVGSGNVLSKCSGYTGLYLGMTGNTISGREMVDLGLATHFVVENEWDSVIERTLQSGCPDDVLEPYKVVIKPYIHQDKIDKYFGKVSVEDIFDALRNDRVNDDWCDQVYNGLSKCCPTSLKVVFKHFHLSKKAETIADVLKMDYRLSQNMTIREDFYNGVSAVLIDKTGNPNWLPPNIYEVDDKEIEVLFGACLNGEVDLEILP